jgi:uncharacterized protein
MKRFRTFALLALAALPCGLSAQTGRLVDAHVHHNGDPKFLEALTARLDKYDGLALVITAPKDLAQVKRFIDGHPNRIAGLGEISLDDPNAVQLVEKFAQAGFVGLGELTKPKKNFDDRSYWPIYERAEKYRMILLFHTGIVNRTTPDIPEDASSDRMRPMLLDGIARRFPKLSIIGAHLGNPDYANAAETARWNPNLYFDLSGSSLIKKQEDYTFFKSIFWWSSIASPHTPKGGPSAFEKLVFGSDIFGGELEEFDREMDRYQRMLDACGVSKQSQANIFSGTMRKLLEARKTVR